MSNSVSVPFTSYDNQLLCQYNIDCGEGQQAYINLTALDLQGDGDCSYEGRPKYASYIATYQLLKFTAGVRITSSLTVVWIEQQRFVATTFLRILHSH